MKETQRKTHFLPLDEAHIWSAFLFDCKKDIDYLKSILSQDEQERARNFKFSKNQAQYIIARGVLRCLLSTYLGKPPQSIEFTYGLWGKPYLLGEPALHFSVSHSGDYALYAFARQYEVGIDIECINNKLEMEDIISSILSPAKREQWDSILPEKRIQAFFHLWARKEAYLKALAKGWLENKTETYFESVLAFKKSFQIRSLLRSTVTYPYCFECIPGYASALFVKGPALRVIYDDFSLC